MSTRATRRIVAQVAANDRSVKPRNGLTATKCLSGHKGAILRQAPATAAAMAGLVVAAEPARSGAR